MGIESIPMPILSIELQEFTFGVSKHRSGDLEDGPCINDTFHEGCLLPFDFASHDEADAVFGTEGAPSTFIIVLEWLFLISFERKLDVFRHMFAGLHRNLGSGRIWTCVITLTVPHCWNIPDCVDVFIAFDRKVRLHDDASAFYAVE